MALKLISIGATYGEISNLNDVLPCVTTVSRHLDAEVTKAKTALMAKVAKVGQFGITTDLWTHQHTNDSYITVTAQYVDIADGWHIQTQVLATRVVNERHAADNVRSVVDSILKEFGAARPSNIFISDNASNMKAAFRDHTWLSCACHNLNLVLYHGLHATADAEAVEQCGLPREVSELIDACKEVVTLAKRTKLNCQLETTLKQCVVTRWNSVLTTLKLVSANFSELQVISISNEDKSNRYWQLILL
jgi:hypothetical protein